MNMGNLTIFAEASSVPTVRRQSKLLDKMGGSVSLRRIATNTNGTFKRIVGGEQVGKAVAHALDIIVVDLLPEVSREFYANDYDPDAKATLPDCWSNDGVKPEAEAANKQAASCAKCPKNVDGSGNKGKGRACRFKRRIAVLIAGDPSGEVYQMSFAATSLFGKGTDNVHPFESYKNFLKANGEGLDTVVTRAMYDLESDTMRLKFQPVRHLTDVEAGLVEAAQEDPETQKYIALSVGESSATKTQAIAAPATKTVTVDAEVVAAPKPAPAPKPTNPFEDGDEEEDAAPVVAKRSTKKVVDAPAPEVKEKLSAVLSAWVDDEDEE
jgi:hypothetical protein